MTTDKAHGTLLHLSDSELTVADEAHDVRGRKVLDSGGEEIGDVDDLLLDNEESRVRYLEVASGGFLGMGEKKYLVPVDAITSIDADNVHIDKDREFVAGAPDYDPDVVRKTDDYYNSLYGYWGYAGYWAPGYAYPAYPYY